MIVVYFKWQLSIWFELSAKVIHVSVDGEFPVCVSRKIIAHKELASKRNVPSREPAMPEALEISVLVGQWIHEMRKCEIVRSKN